MNVRSTSASGIGGGQPVGAPLNLTFAPTTGQTVAFVNSPLDQLMTITPAGNLAALTIQLPSDATTRLTQFCRVAITKSVTTVTWTGSANIANPPTTFNANDTAAMQKTAADTWMKS